MVWVLMWAQAQDCVYETTHGVPAHGWGCVWRAMAWCACH